MKSILRFMLWRLEPLKTWDRSKPRGSELFLFPLRKGTAKSGYHKLKPNGVRVAQVIPFRVNFTDFEGWYWVAEYAGSDGVKCIPTKKTVHDPVSDLKKAREDCEVYVRGCLGKPKHGPRRRLSWVRDTSDPNRSTVLSPPCGGKFLLNETVVVGEVKPFRVRFGEYLGWYWTAKLPPLEEFAHLTVAPKSTKDTPVCTMEVAKRACDEYLRSQLLISPLKKRDRSQK